MKFRIKNNLSQKIPNILRRAGYMKIHDSKTGQESFVHKLTGDHYPRFHLYITETKNEIIFDLHLDQRATRYEGQKAHGAEYESEEVKEELTRVYHVVSSFRNK